MTTMKKLILSISMFVLLTALPVHAQSTVGYQQGYARNKAEALHEGLWDGLVGCWSPSLGNTGLQLRDQVRGNHGTLTNMDGSNWVVTENGYSLEFDGVSEEVAIPNHESLNVFNGDFTIITSLRSSESTNAAPIISQYNNNSPRWAFRIVDASVTGSGAAFYSNGSSGTKRTGSSIVVNDGLTHTIAVVRKASAVNILTDGIDNTTVDGGHSVDFNTSDTLMIGRNEDPSINTQQSLDFILIYNRALTQSEIQQLYVDPQALFRLKPQPFVVPVAASTRRIMFISQYINDLIETYKYN